MLNDRLEAMSQYAIAVDEVLNAPPGHGNGGVDESKRLESVIKDLSNARQKVLDNASSELRGLWDGAEFAVRDQEKVGAKKVIRYEEHRALRQRVFAAICDEALTGSDVPQARRVVDAERVSQEVLTCVDSFGTWSPDERNRVSSAARAHVVQNGVEIRDDPNRPSEFSDELLHAAAMEFFVEYQQEHLAVRTIVIPEPLIDSDAEVRARFEGLGL